MSLEMNTVLATDGLTKRFGHITAVNAVTFSVARGETFGILGRNGAGKTTLIKMLTTLLPPTSGSASIAGHDLAREAATVRRLIGYVPQSLSSDPDLTARENLQIQTVLYDIPRAQRRERIDSILALVGLEDAANRLVKTYSGGMTRRLEIGQAMLHRPLLLFLDEPTVGLDPVAREAIWKHVQQLRAELGVAVCLTTHYMDEAQQLCSRFLVLRSGAAAAMGSLAELRAAAGRGDASLDDLFGLFTGDGLAQERHDGSITDTRRAAGR
jgi:ABC-2 type transport system ATP-binding protein